MIDILGQGSVAPAKDHHRRRFDRRFEWAAMRLALFTRFEATSSMPAVVSLSRASPNRSAPLRLPAFTTRIARRGRVLPLVTPAKAVVSLICSKNRDSRFRGNDDRGPQ
jgi:hypothetical protein